MKSEIAKLIPAGTNINNVTGSLVLITIKNNGHDAIRSKTEIQKNTAGFNFPNSKPNFFEYKTYKKAAETAIETGKVAESQSPAIQYLVYNTHYETYNKRPYPVKQQNLPHFLRPFIIVTLYLFVIKKLLALTSCEKPRSSV